MRTEGRPKITRIEAVEFFVELENLGMTADGCEMQYMPGETLRPMRYVLTIDTNTGVRGEFVGRRPESYNQLQRVAGRILGRSALDRERIYGELKRQFRATINLATAPLDIALWDLAGKLYGAPIYELLGGSDDPLPAYASTHFGDASGGLDSPEAFADFAVRCKEMGYPAFKIHGWGAPIEREVRLVTAVREAVGDGMQLMHDPGCTYRTFLEALTVGKALDDANYLWYEDPYMDGGMSAFGNKKLRELLRTPILITEHIRGLEQHVDRDHRGRNGSGAGRCEPGRRADGRAQNLPRRRGLWFGRRNTLARSGAPAPHGVDPQLELLRNVAGPPQGPHS